MIKHDEQNYKVMWKEGYKLKDTIAHRSHTVCKEIVAANDAYRLGILSTEVF